MTAQREEGRSLPFDEILNRYGGDDSEMIRAIYTARRVAAKVKELKPGSPKARRLISTVHEDLRIPLGGTTVFTLIRNAVAEETLLEPSLDTSSGDTEAEPKEASRIPSQPRFHFDGDTIVWDPETHAARIEENENKLTDEPKWLQTFRKVPLREAVWFIRLAKGQTRREFAQDVGNAEGTIKNVEEGKSMLGLQFINKIIKKRFDQEGQAAQLLRLLSQGEKAMTLEELDRAPIGKLVRYLRIVQGQEQTEVAEKLMRDSTVISNIESGKNSCLGHEDAIPDLWLKLPADSALRKIIKHKILSPNKSIDDNLLQAVLQERFLFVDSSKDRKKTPARIQELVAVVEAKETIGQALFFLRQDRPLTKKYMRLVELDKKHIRDYVLASHLSELGYDIHHPVAQYLLRWNYQEKKLRDEKSVAVSSLQNLVKHRQSPAP